MIESIILKFCSKIITTSSTVFGKSHTYKIIKKKRNNKNVFKLHKNISMVPCKANLEKQLKNEQMERLLGSNSRSTKGSNYAKRNNNLRLN